MLFLTEILVLTSLKTQILFILFIQITIIMAVFYHSLIIIVIWSERQPYSQQCAQVSSLRSNQAVSWGKDTELGQESSLQWVAASREPKTNAVAKSGCSGPSENPICRDLCQEGRFVPGVSISQEGRRLSAWLLPLCVCQFHPHHFSGRFPQPDRSARAARLPGCMPRLALQETAWWALLQLGKAQGRSLIAQLWVSRLVSDTPLLLTFIVNKSESYQCYSLLSGSS